MLTSCSRLLLLTTCLSAQNPDPQQAIEPLKTTVQVTASVAAEVPASQSTLDERKLQQLPGVNLDDRLRNVPGFTLFRRTSSLVANPTTQGVSLRGIGSTGASRTLVLWDGLPLNDPFGGWVYWTRVAPEDLARVEVTRGAAISAFGDRAMGGVINLFTRTPEPGWQGFAGVEGGTQETLLLRAGGSWTGRRFGVSSNFRGGTTEGYYIVPSSIRGRADTKAGVDWAAGVFRADYLGDKQKAFLRFDVLAEERANGTVLQRNDTGLGMLSGSYSRDFGKSQLSAVLFHQREQFHASFSTVLAGRNSERLTALQTVPATATGYAVVYTHTQGPWSLLAGADLNRVQGESREQLFPTGSRIGGGTLLQHGYFVQGRANFKQLTLFAGVRPQWIGDGEFLAAPNGGITYAIRNLRLRASGYRAYRAPTLNELYRDFAVGNAITRANASLQPETLTGVEVGADHFSEFGRIGLTLFRNDLDALITNVTLSTGATIIRQRRNAAAALNRGVEVDWQNNWGPVSAQLGYLFVESRFSTGERLPQIPKHQGTAILTYTRNGTLVSGGLRATGLQFEDDLNRFRLPGFAVLQLTGQQRLVRRLSATVAVENLLDREFVVGFSPTPLIGNPRLFRVGLRWN